MINAKSMQKNLTDQLRYLAYVNATFGTQILIPC
jgi:hypothetical protein